MATPHKVHKIGLITEGVDHPLCKQKARLLLPLAVVWEWDQVTCVRCLKHRPAEPLSWIVRWWQRIRGTR